MGETRQNPYVTGGAIIDSNAPSFYGREDVFNFIRSAILSEQRSPILIYGQRRIGKSSILRQIPYHLPTEIRCVYFDLQGKGSMNLDQVLFGLAREIAARLGLPKPTREDATTETFGEKFLSNVVKFLNGHAEYLVLLFDEFDVVDDRIAGERVAAREFIGYLGNLISQYPKIGYILVVGRRAEELSPEVNGTLLRQALQYKVGRLSKDNTFCLVEEPSKGILTFQENSLERIFELTTGHPFCIQLLCFTIWSQYIHDQHQYPVQVTSDMVDQALQPALEFGTLGLNWIFDSLDRPAYRLFLAALAEATVLAKRPTALMREIEQLVQKHVVSFDQIDFARAPVDLEKWDVARHEETGFALQVPMIGLWIVQERSLSRLEKEILYANPKAYQYYELALEAHRNKDLERAITDYQGALKENPNFYEAQLGLADALRERNCGDDDCKKAISAYQTALELNPDMPVSGYIETLLRAIGSLSIDDVTSSTFSKDADYYQVFLKMKPGDAYRKIATEKMLDRAQKCMGAEKFDDARKLFDAMGETNLAKAAGRRGGWGCALAFFSGLLSLAALVFVLLSSVFNINDLFRLFFWALMGASIYSSTLAPLFIDNLNRRPFLDRTSLTSWLLRLAINTAVGLCLGGLLWVSLMKNSIIPYIAAFLSSLVGIAIMRGLVNFFRRRSQPSQKG